MSRWHADARQERRETGSWNRVLFLALLGFLPLVAGAQVSIQGKLKNFKFPDYYTTAAPNQTNQLKTLLSGAEAWQLPGGQVRINGLRIENYREDGHRELEVRATECVFDLGTREASGAGHLDVVSANGLYALEGDGFQWQQSNSFLIISNRAVTTLQRGMLASFSASPGASTNAVLPLATGLQTNEVVRITSDSCRFDSQSNRVVQSGHVVVDDAQMQLRCETLRVQLTPNRRLQELVAEEAVSILSKADESRATARRGVYEIAQDKENIVLSGEPVWRDRDGRMEARASHFDFDRTAKQIRGEGGATMRLPRGSFSQPSLLGAGLAATTNAPPKAADTNQIQITSETLTLLLPTTNRPYRSAIAESNVVILSPADDTRATGTKATYREDTGLMELAGQAKWEAEGRLVSADALTMDRTNKVFSGRGNTLFRLPLHQGGQGLALPVSTNRAAATNLMLEVQAQELTYRSNALVFRGGEVRARVLEGKALRGLITCGLLTAHFVERLESVVAEKHVVAENYPPVGETNRVVTNVLSCEVLTATFSADGSNINLRASENVQAAQVEYRPASPKATVTELTCGLLTLSSSPKAGKVDKIVAEQHVVMSQEDKVARGGRAVYTDKENQLVLSDHPYAEFAEGKVTGADTLVWDRATGKFKGRGRYRLQWTKPAGTTNKVRLPFLKK